jgi:hypothetical protein
VDCTGNFVYVANWYASSVSAFAINPASGSLTALSGPPFAAGNSPLAIASTCPMPPAIGSVSASSDTLWPPNHEFVDVSVSYTVTSAISASCNLSVSSNEPEPGESKVEDAHHVLLLAERDGSGSGRVYTITIDCSNAVGSTTAQATVLVPHDQRR